MLAYAHMYARARAARVARLCSRARTYMSNMQSPIDNLSQLGNTSHVRSYRATAVRKVRECSRIRPSRMRVHACVRVCVRASIEMCFNQSNFLCSFAKYPFREFVNDSSNGYHKHVLFVRRVIGETVSGRDNGNEMQGWKAFGSSSCKSVFVHGINAGADGIIMYRDGKENRHQLPSVTLHLT